MLLVTVADTRHSWKMIMNELEMSDKTRHKYTETKTDQFNQRSNKTKLHNRIIFKLNMNKM